MASPTIIPTSLSLKISTIAAEAGPRADAASLMQAEVALDTDSSEKRCPVLLRASRR